jgi:hypothetical protein
MMFITPMPPTNRPMEENHHHQAHRGDELAELADHTFGAGDAEVVGVGRFDPAAAAEQFGHLVPGLIHSARLH